MHEGVTDGEAALASALDTFTRDGCLLLVTGDVTPAVSARASRKLLGAPTADRTRVLAITDPDVDDPLPHLPGTLTADSTDVTLLDCRRRGSLPAPDDATDRVEEHLPDPSTVVAGETRFVVVSLTPYLDQDADAVPAMLDALQAAARERDAIGAVHLPTPDDDEHVAALDPHLDARVELRTTSDALPEQRWHLPDETTNWVTM